MLPIYDPMLAVEGRIGVGQGIGVGTVEAHLHAAVLGLGSCPGQCGRVGVEADHGGLRVLLLGPKGQSSSATADVEHPGPGLDARPGKQLVVGVRNTQHSPQPTDHRDAITPLRWLDGRALLMVAAYRWQRITWSGPDGSSGQLAPYGEVGVAALTSVGPAPRALPLLLDQATSTILQLPVTTREARDGGRSIYGMPKFLADMDRGPSFIGADQCEAVAGQGHRWEADMARMSVSVCG